MKMTMRNDEALAYCDWLTEALRASPHTPQRLQALLAKGWRVTLPNECDWQKAACGPSEPNSNPCHLFACADDVAETLAVLNEVAGEVNELYKTQQGKLH
jgi:hypothetical protein